MSTNTLKAIGERVLALEKANEKFKDRLDIVETELQCAHQANHTQLRVPSKLGIGYVKRNPPSFFRQRPKKRPKKGCCCCGCCG
jgi:hypothetical protein